MDRQKNIQVPREGWYWLRLEGEKNIRLAAAAQWDIKPGRFVLFNLGESRGKKKI